MDLYADVLELIGRTLVNALLATIGAIAVGAVLVAVLGSGWLALVSAIALLAPLGAVIATVRSHARSVRERSRRAAYEAGR